MGITKQQQQPLSSVGAKAVFLSVEKYAYIEKGREPDQIVRTTLAQALPGVGRCVDHIVAPVVNLFLRRAVFRAEDIQRAVGISVFVHWGGRRPLTPP